MPNVSAIPRIFPFPLSNLKIAVYPSPSINESANQAKNKAINQPLNQATNKTMNRQSPLPLNQQTRLFTISPVAVSSVIESPLNQPTRH